MITQPERDRIVYRVIAGILRCNVCINNKNISILIKSVSAYHRYIAEEVYSEELKKYSLEGLKSEEELLDFLLEKGLWDEDKEERFNGLQKDIEELKVGLFNTAFKSNERKTIKKSLANAKLALEALYSERHAYDYLSAAGAAAAIKARYLITNSLHYAESDEPIYREADFWRSDDFLIEQVIEIISEAKLSEAIARDIVRNDPWRTIWTVKKACGGRVFDTASAELTEDQRTLSMWAGIYDNIYEHPESPSDDVIEDDDRLDGWMIVQRRKCEADKRTGDAEQLISNENIRNSEEIFIPVNTTEDAYNIELLNNPTANAVKRRRLALLQQRGAVREADMPDSKLKIQQQLTQMYVQQMKGS